VLLQAAGFALLAAVSPSALLVMAMYLGSARPLMAALVYLAGAVVMTTLIAVAVLIAIRAGGLQHPEQHAPRYGLRLGLGVLALVFAGLLWAWRPVRERVARRAARRRAARSHTARSHTARSHTARSPAAPQAGRERHPGASSRLMTRLTERPSACTAFLAGLVLFAPSATFIAAVQVIATARQGVPVTSLGVVIVVLIDVAVIWLPLLTFLAAPAATARRLTALNGFLRANGRNLLTGAALIAGVALVIDGATGLALPAARVRVRADRVAARTVPAGRVLPITPGDGKCVTMRTTFGNRAYAYRLENSSATVAKRACRRQIVKCMRAQVDCPAPDVAICKAMSNTTPRKFPVTVSQLPVTRCKICRRTLAYRPGQASAVLTEHYRRAHPEELGLSEPSEED
jgi:hypothetical protein